MSNIKQLNKHKNNKNKSEMKHKALTFRFLDMSRGGFARLFLLLLLPCLSVIGVKPADSNGGVKVTFNPAVRYSQWAINSRLHDFYGNQKKFGFDYYDNKGNKTTPVTWYKLDGKTKVERSFDYVAGLVGKASLEAADFYENFDWSKPWFYAAQGYATGTPYANANANTNMTLDNMNAAKMYFPILAGNLKSQEATTVANTAINAVIEHMRTYNSTYVIGSGESALNSTNANNVQKTMFGGWFHKSTDYTDQMWCDGQYMGPALLAQIIKHTGKTNNISDNDWDIVAKQFSITWAQLHDTKTGLLYHGFTANPGDVASKSWAGINKEKGIYHSASFWGRANAWYFLALVDILEVMPTDNAYYNTFKGYLTSLAEGIAKYQDKSTGCWYQVMDKLPASLTDNYLEASCSSIFTAGYLKAIRLGLLDKTTYEPIAKKAYAGLVNQFMVYDNKDNSTIQLVHSCTSAGLGGSNGRAGDDNYYLTGDDAKVVTSDDPTSKYYYTEGKVLGGFIMAATEYERAYQSQSEASKQILFANDLKSDYDFSSTAGSLSVEVCGTDADKATYQWYKGESKIDNATEATYTPTESGAYHCIATVNSTNIKSSTANVIAKTSSNAGNDNTSNSNSEKATIEGAKLANITSGPITSGAITLTPKATSGISANSGNGFKIKNGGFTISAKDGAKIKSITITQSATSRELTFSPSGTKTNNDKVFTYNYTSLPSEIDVTGPKSSLAITSIVIEYETTSSKTNLTATFASSSLTAKEGDASVDVPALTVKAGDTELSTSDYNVTYASTNESVAKVENGKVVYGSKGTATITATITPTATNKYNNTTASFTVTVNEKPADPTKASTIYDLVNNVGTTTNGTNCTASNGKITLGSDYRGKEGKYITIAPSNGGFKTGDVITIKGYCDSKNASGVEIHSNATGESIFKTNTFASSSNNGPEYTFTLTED